MKTISLTTLAFCMIFVGCSKPESNTVVMNDSPPGMEDDHAAHAHPEHGPHGGELVELGKEAFHLELTHSDDGIAMYVLDGSATKSVAIEAEKLVVSLKHDGEVKSFNLPASPEVGNSEEADAEGKTSRFVSDQEELDEWLDAGAEGAVVIEIEGKSYTGKISHDHDHEGHDH